MYSDIFKYDGSRPFNDAVLAAQCLDDIARHPGTATVYVCPNRRKLRSQGEAAFGNMMRIMGVI